MSLAKKNQSENNSGKIEKLIAESGPEQLSKQWFSVRENLVTGSVAAAILGINPYQTREEVMLKKLGLGPKFKGNAATRHGQRYEDEAIRKYELATGEECIQNDFGLKIHPKYKFLGASPDGITKSLKLLEVKCPMSRKIIFGDMPQYYMPQCQLLMQIFDLQVCHFIEYKPEDIFEDMSLNIVEMKRDDDWFEAAVPIFRRFSEELKERREFLKNNPLPPPEPKKPLEIVWKKNGSKCRMMSDSDDDECE